MLSFQLLCPAVLIILYSIFYSQLLFLGIILFFVFYWTSSIFIFLFKTGVYTTTSVIQRFWKRTLYLFWTLELFLFFIYTWLVLISPSEVEWLFDQSQLYSSNYIRGGGLFAPILLTMTILYLMVWSQYYLGSLKFYFILILVLFLLWSVLFSDGSQVIVTSLYYNDLSIIYNSDTCDWVAGVANICNRTISNYTWLVVILKFWHTAFIVIFFLIALMFLLQTNYNFYGLYSSIIQNFIFLFLFSFIMYYFILKTYLNVTYEYVFNWFFINKFRL